MTDREFLTRAIDLAKKSPEPIGCGVLIVKDGNIVAKAFNSQRTDQIAVNHAEIKAIVAANMNLQSRVLEGATAYCSCEPCAMCLAALSYAKVKRIVFDKSMKDVFPNDPQSKLDPYKFVAGLNFVPNVEQIRLN